MCTKIKKSALLTAALIICGCFYGCSGQGVNNSDSGIPEITEADSAGKMPSVEKRELTDEEKSIAEQSKISEERYCTDKEGISAVAKFLLDQYYNGMVKADHDMCYTSFPDFYKKAIEEENKTYDETDEETMKNIYKSFVDKYGGDFTVNPTINSVLQLSDDSMETVKNAVNEAFDTQIVLDDAYYVYFSENVSGSLDNAVNALSFALIDIDGAYYLYDDYFENRE